MKSIKIAAQIESPSEINVVKTKRKTSKSNEMDLAYDPKFVAMIKKGEQDINKGKGFTY